MFEQASWHPLIVHAPLVLIPVSVLFALIDFIRPALGLRVAGVLLLVGGVGGAVLASQTGESAEHEAVRESRSVRQIGATGLGPTLTGTSSLIQTHAALGEMTRNVYGLLLLADGALLAASLPALKRFRGNRTLSARWQRIGRGAWIAVAALGLVLVVLTGHYGGQLVYDHGVGISTAAQTAQSP
jgi:uncharacterized membrane protein